MGQQHGRERRMQMLGDLAVVVAHDRDVVRNSKPEFAQRLVGRA
jgi:hypothetical protein